MGLYNRKPIFVTSCLIAALVFAEAAVAWHFLSDLYRQGKRGRLTQYESGLQRDTTELDRIMLFRDAENRRLRLNDEDNKDVLGTPQGASARAVGPMDNAE